MRQVYSYICILLLLGSGKVWGQQQEINIGEVLIEGASVESALALRKESVSGKYIIPRADLVAFGYSTAGDVIKNLPMVYLDGDPGVNRNVSIGGLEREYQSILINGKSPAGGEDSRDLKLDRIPVSMIERIEIDYNAPVSEGSQGIAGTVNIILKEDMPQQGVNLNLETNINTSDPTPGIKANAEGALNVGKTNIYGGLSYNSYERLKVSELEDSSSDTDGTIEELIVTDAAAATLSLLRPAGNYSDISFDGFFSWFDEDEFEDAEVKRRKDGTLNLRQTNTDNDKLRYLMMYDLGYEFDKNNNKLAISAGFSNNYEKRHKDQLAEKSDFVEEAMEYEDQDNYMIDGSMVYSRDSIQSGRINMKLKAGADWSLNVRNTDRINGTRPEGYLLWDLVDESYGYDETILSAFSELELCLSEKFSLVPALRYEYSDAAFTTSDTTGSSIYKNLSPSVHLKYNVSENLVINASAARHFSRPAFMSMVPVEKVKIKKDLIEVGNPELLPSKANAFNLGASYYLNRNSYLSANLYYKDVKDMIAMQYTGIDDQTGYNLFKFVNIDTASLYGFYLDARIDFDPITYSGFTMYLSYSWMGSKINDEYSGGVKRVDDQPAHLANIRLDYLNTSRRINFSLSANYNSRRVISPYLSDEGVDIAETIEDSYINMTARIKYFFRERGSVYIAGDNLLLQPVNIAQGTVNERIYPGMILRLGYNHKF